MKQRIIICVLLLITASLHAEWVNKDEYNAFRKLPAEEKVRFFLEKFKFRQRGLPVDVELGAYERVFYRENPEENIPVLLGCLERVEMIPYPPPSPDYRGSFPPGYDRSYDLLNDIICTYFLRDGLLNQDEQNRLYSIYQQKIHDYLTTYKVVDVRLASTERTKEEMKGQRPPNFTPTYVREVYYKYAGLGYKGLRLDLSFWTYADNVWMAEAAENLNADEFSIFSQLPAEEKVRFFLEKFRFKELIRPEDAEIKIYEDFFYYLENRKEYIPILLDFFERTKMPPYPPLLSHKNGFSYPPDYDRSFDLLISILDKWLYVYNLFNQDEQARLASIYQQKIHEYLNAYKVVDARVVNIEMRKERILLPKKNNNRLVTYAREVYNKYARLGYKGLRLDFK
jgi:hypothetical protein